MDDHEDKIGQAIVDVVRKDVVIVEQVVGIKGVGRVRLCGALAMAGLVHVTLLGCIVDLDVTTNGLGSETREPFQITFIDCVG
jgi:hypothetical protein